MNRTLWLAKWVAWLRIHKSYIQKWRVLPASKWLIILRATGGDTVPRYDYRCKNCSKTFTIALPSINDAETASPACPKCGSTDLSRLIKRVRYLMGDEARLERLSDPSRLSGIDEDDPRGMARLMREMANEVGEEAGPEFHEAVDRLESGESLDSIDSSFGGDSDL
jgi:putative FmdB family regulatory protein